jgi:hypothetical protein
MKYGLTFISNKFFGVYGAPRACLTGFPDLSDAIFGVLKRYNFN